MESPLSPPPSSDGVRRHHRVHSISSKQDMVPQRPASAHARIQSPLPVVIAPLLAAAPPTLQPSESPASRERSAEGGSERESAEDPIEPAEEERRDRVRSKFSPLPVTTQHLQLSAPRLKETPVGRIHTFSDTTALSNSDQESSLRLRKGSEPPPSLLAQFERDGGRKAHKQLSYEEESVHLKQHSLDSSYLNTSQGSPRHSRRMKSPVLPCKKTEMTRTPSHPHLHQASSTPLLPPSSQSLTKAHSIQQLRAASPSEQEEGRNQRSYSGGVQDMQRLKPLRLQKQEQTVASGSKDSLHSSNTSSVASLKTKSEVGKEKSQRVKMRSIDSVPMRSYVKSSSDMWRRNSSQIGLRRELVTGGRGGMRPHSMVETSSLRPLYSMELNPTPAALVAQMFWTAVCLLESDFEAEFSMALRLISKVIYSELC